MHQEKAIKGKASPLESSFSIIYLTVILIIVLSSFQDYFLVFFLASESSPIQSFSVVGYFIAFATAIILQLQGRITFGVGAAVIFLSMGLRELDFNERFTTMGIMKSRFYLSDIVPIKEKIIVLMIVLPLVCFIAVFLKKNFRFFLAALKTRNKAALLAANGILFTIIAKLIDSNSSILFCITEETMELAIPYFFLCAMLLYAKGERENSIQATRGE